MKKVVILLVVFLQACATSYQSGKGSYTGGVFEAKGPGKLILITFSGNGYIDTKTAEIYTLYRCAEYTIEQGNSHFIVYSNLFDAAADKRSAKMSIGSIGGKPLNRVYILMRKNPEGNTFDAVQLINKYNDVVNKKG